MLETSHHFMDGARDDACWESRNPYDEPDG